MTFCMIVLVSLVPCDVFGISSARNVLLGICEMEVRMMRESGFWEVDEVIYYLWQAFIVRRVPNP